MDGLVSDIDIKASRTTEEILVIAHELLAGKRGPIDDHAFVFASWLSDTLGAGQDCGGIEPIVTRDSEGYPAVVMPDTWPGYYTPDDTAGHAKMLLVARDQANAMPPKEPKS